MSEKREEFSWLFRHEYPAVVRTLDDELRAALLALPRAQRAAVVLFYLEDIPVAEIAGLLGCRQSTVRVPAWLAGQGRCGSAWAPVPRAVQADGTVSRASRAWTPSGTAASRSLPRLMACWRSATAATGSPASAWARPSA
jgi:hypothetical protein